MNRRFKLLCVATLLAASVSAQNQKVTGHVVDETGQPVIGATVMENGTSNGTITDIDGNFTLQVKNAAKGVSVSYIGYEKQNLKVNGKVMNIQLKSEATSLNELVVVGFSTQKKVNLTGAVATVDKKALQNRPVQNVTQALQGASPGLNITATTGKLDATPSVNVRGMTTIGEGSNGSPLVLIDGIEGDMNTLNPDDIDQISILKDASSAAIYGSRAAFGVILITTKNGKEGEPTVNYKNSFRWSSPMGLQDYADSYSWALFFNDADLTGNYFTQDHLDRILAYQKGELKDPKLVNEDGTYVSGWYHGSHANVNWAKELYKKNSFSQEHQASITGGTKKTNYYASIDYLGQNGMLKYGTDSYNRIAATGKISTNFWKICNLTYTSRYVRVNSKYPSTFNDQYREFGRLQWPMFPVYDNNGHLDADGGMAYSFERNKDGKSNKRTTISQHAVLTVTPLKDWTITGEINYYGNDDQYHQDYKKTYLYDIYDNEILYDGSSSAAEQVYHGNKMSYSLYSNFDKVWAEKHHLHVTAGFQAESFNDKYLSMSRQGLVLDDYTDIDNTTGLDRDGNVVSPTVSGYRNKWRTAGFFGRLSYDYQGKYLVEFNARYDGTSRFRKENRWVLSPSVSAGWNMAKEKFFKPLNKWIDMLKVRGSYGQLANQNTSSYYPTYVTMPVSVNSGTWLVNNYCCPIKLENSIFTLAHACA